MKALPEKFIERMRNYKDLDFEGFIGSYAKPPVRGLRVNTLKISADGFKSVCPWELHETGILDEGFTVTGAENVGRHPYHAAGLFYMQEPSAMSAVAASLTDGSGLRVLDMCAAPGGKSGGAAARMRGRGILISNEIVPKRATLLSRNLERLGVKNAAVISAKPDDVARELPEFFDTVLVDAPCSGEGMFRKDETAILEWSPEHVLACAARQSLILESAACCVKAGGCLVYSTCTFSREENEDVIEKFLDAHKDFTVEHMERLYPHTSVGEGHFVCRLRRGGSAENVKVDCVRGTRDKKALSALDVFLSDCAENVPEGIIDFNNDTLRLVPDGMPEAVKRLRPVALGVELGTLRKGRLEPSHSFFMAELGVKFRRELVYEADDKELKAFLSGSTVPCPEGFRGYSRIAVRAGEGAYSIGFGKAVDGVMKNHLPKGLYI